MQPHNHLTQGRLVAGLFRLAGPMFLSSILQNAQSLIDLFWVGRLGSESVAALAAAGALLFLMWPVAMGMSVGAVALVSRHTGAGRPDRAAEAAGQSLSLAVLAGLLLGGVAIVALPLLLGVIGAEPAVSALARAYLIPSFAGYATVFFLALSGAALQGAGDAIRPMVAMAAANLINLVLDPILIFGWFGMPALGVRGAAWATVFAQGAACLLVGIWLFRGIPRLRVRLAHLRPRFAVILALFRIGVFSAGQMLARSLMIVVLFRIVAACGTAALAAYGIGMRFHHMVLLPSFVLGNAVAAMVGQNLGAGRPDRAARAAWLGAGVGMTINLGAAVLFVSAAAWLTGLFDSNPEVIGIGAQYLRIVSPFYIFAALGIVLGRGMNGAGDTFPTMLITLVTLWGVQVPLAFLFVRLFDPAVTGVWWSIAGANTLNGLITAAWFQVGRWKLRRVE